MQLEQNDFSKSLEMDEKTVGQFGHGTRRETAWSNTRSFS